MASFGSVQVKNMVAVGRTGATSAQLWMRSECPGPHVLELWPQSDAEQVTAVPIAIPDTGGGDFTHSVVYPNDFAGVPPLAPLTVYRFKVKRFAAVDGGKGYGGDGTPLGEGRFETAPQNGSAMPSKISVAVMSCHQPFNSDGERSSRSMRMLRLAPQVLRDHDAKFILACGDQIYADAPGDFSLVNPHFARKLHPEQGSIFEWSAQEVRAAYQERYRTYFAMNEWRHLWANYPIYPILDDHELMDDWGSSPEHATDAFRAFKAGARAAYFDYQGSLVLPRSTEPPRSLHYSFSYGSVGVFVTDIRSERIAFPAGSGQPNQLFSTRQFADFDRFLEMNGDKRVLLLVTSVPVVHLPSWLTDVGAAVVGSSVDFPDHWSYRKNVSQRDLFLTRLHQHQQQYPEQRVVLVSGDVHIGCAFAIHWQGGNQPITYQFTSSAISNRMKKSDTYFSRLGPELTSTVRCNGDRGPDARVNLLRAAAAGDPAQNPFGGLNLGIIEIQQNAGGYANVRLKLVGYPPDDQWEPAVAFTSGWL